MFRKHRTGSFLCSEIAPPLRCAQDSSEDSGAEGKRLAGSRWGARGARASDGGGDDGCMGCGDASCSNCDPHAFSRVLESFPDHAESVDFRSLQPPFVKPGPPLAFATPESTSSFMHHMTEESGCESGQCRHRELAKAAASAVFKEVFGERKAQHQEDGTFAEESKEGNRNPEGLSISVSDSEEGREREGDVVGAGGNESDDSEGEFSFRLLRTLQSLCRLLAVSYHVRAGVAV